MEMKSLSSFWASIYVGLKETHKKPPITHTIEEIENVCQEYCDRNGFCVSVTSTKFIYTKGNEPGVVVGIISYPRFPSDSGELRRRAIELAELLRQQCLQFKVSIVMPNEVVMLGED